MDQHSRNFFRDATETSGNLSQKLKSAFTIVSEGKPLAQVNLACVETPEDVSQQKVIGTYAGKFRRKIEHHSLIDAQPLHPFHLLFECLKQGGAVSGCSTARGCGSKVTTVAGTPSNAARLDYAAHNQLMGEVKTIEHTEGQDCRRVNRAVIYSTDDSHSKSDCREASNHTSDPGSGDWCLCDIEAIFLHFNHQSIISDLDILRQVRARFRVLYVMRNMGKQSAVRLQPFNVAE